MEFLSPKIYYKLILVPLGEDMKVNALTEWLYFHLWKEEDGHVFSSGQIKIPDTLIYRWTMPHFWYRSENKRVVRSKKGSIDPEALQKAFSLDLQGAVISENQNQIDVCA